MAHTTCLGCLFSTVSGYSKKAKNVVLVVGAQQKLEQSFSSDIYGLIRKYNTYIKIPIQRYLYKGTYTKVLIQRYLYKGAFNKRLIDR